VALRLCGPLCCLPGLVAMPISLSLATHSNCADKYEASSCATGISVLVMIALLLAIIHYSNASTMHHYFSFVENEQYLIFGEAIRTARQERLRSHGPKRGHLVVVFALCGIDSCWRDPESFAKYQMRQAEVLEEEIGVMQPGPL
jgi:hypothetical protein